MSKVYVVQNQMKFNQDTGNFEQKFDFSTAEQYGKLVFLLSPTARPFSPEHIVGALRDRLHEFNDEDYLLLIGNPCLIGFAVAIAADMNDGRIKVLQWNGSKKQYAPVSADLLF